MSENTPQFQSSGQSSKHTEEQSKNFPPRIFGFFEPEDLEENERDSDIDRMVSALATKGGACSRKELFRLWKYHSKSAGCLWKPLPDSPEKLCEVLMIHLTEI